MEAYAPALLTHVHEHALTLAANGLQSKLYLLTAVAPGTLENVTGQALAVDPDQGGLIGRNVPHDKRYVLVLVHQASVGDNLKLPMSGWHSRLSHSLDQILVGAAICDDIGYGDHVDAVRGGELHQMWHPRHVAVFSQHLTDHARWIEPCTPCQVNDGLCMPCPGQHATLGVAQGEYMARTRQALGPCAGVQQRLDSSGAVVG